MTDHTETERVKFALRLAIIAAQLKETREALDSIRADLAPDTADDARLSPPAGRGCAHCTPAGGGSKRRSLPVWQCEGPGRLRPPTSAGLS